MGNYQSAACETSITIQPEGEDKSKEVYELAWNSVKNEIQKQINEFKIPLNS